MVQDINTHFDRSAQQSPLPFDRDAANRALASYDYKKTPPLDASSKAQLELVIKAARDKMVDVVNGHPQIVADFKVFKDWLGRSESSLMRASYKTWIGSAILEKGPEQRAEVTPDDRLLVSPAMSSLIQWRFVILDAEKSLNEIGKGNGNEAGKTFKDRFVHISQFLKETGVIPQDSKIDSEDRPQSSGCTLRTKPVSP